MKTTETINGKVVAIEWEQGEMIENHGSSCRYYAMDGEDEQGNKYNGTGNYQGDDLEEITDVEEA